MRLQISSSHFMCLSGSHLISILFDKDIFFHIFFLSFSRSQTSKQNWWVRRWRWLLRTSLTFLWCALATANVARVRGRKLLEDPALSRTL